MDKKQGRHTAVSPARRTGSYTKSVLFSVKWINNVEKQRPLPESRLTPLTNIIRCIYPRGLLDKREKGLLLWVPQASTVRKPHLGLQLSCLKQLPGLSQTCISLLNNNFLVSVGSEVSEGTAENCREWLWKPHGNPESMVQAKILSPRTASSEGWAREAESR